MKQFLSDNKTALLLVLLAITAAFLRFYNLNWGAPFYFHPDERNIASSVSQLNFPLQMNPHFFAYGSFPIYSIYFLGVMLSSISNFQLSTFNFQLQNATAVSFEQAIIISRFFSSLFSTLMIPLLYIVGERLKGKTAGILAAFFGTFSTGFIQFTHFGTFEIWLSFWGLLYFLACIQLTKRDTNQMIVLAGIIFGILMAIKISSLALFPLIPLSLIISRWRTDKHKYIAMSHLIQKTPVAIFISFFVFITTSPFVLFNFPSFLSGIHYESEVALGALPVFYTQSFTNTAPVIFQLTKIYPFLINPVLTILFLPSFAYIIYKALKKKYPSYYLLFTIFSLLFFSQAFFLAKWTRYMVPTLPFIYLVLSIAIFDFLVFLKLKGRLYHYAKTTFVTLIFTSCVIFSLAYFITVYAKTDTRIAASLWTKEKIPNDVRILSEVHDLGILPFNQYFKNIILFNFYDLDRPNTSSGGRMRVRAFEVERLERMLAQTDYIILLSQRILKTRILNEKKYPKGNSFYKSLVNNTTEYKKVYQTPCDILCKIAYIGNPVFSLEETTTVFDRPTVSIFRKVAP